MTNTIVFRSARVFDGESEILRDGLDVVVANGLIRDLVAQPGARLVYRDGRFRVYRL